MVIRTTLMSVLMVAAAWAQPPAGAPRGRGPGGPGGPGPRLLGAEAGMPGRVVKNAAYSAEIVTESTQVLPDGNRIKRTNSAKVYRDSEGRTRREQSLKNLNGLAGTDSNSSASQVAFINDPVAGANYALDMTNRSATKATFRANPMGGRRGGPPADGGAQPRTQGQSGTVTTPGDGSNGPRMRGPGGPPPNGGLPGMARSRNNQNVKTESLGKQSIEGVLAEGTRTTLTIPAGQIGNEQAIQVVDETWYSSDLQTVVLRKHSDPRSGDSVTKYMNISRAEPPRILFEVPADFKVREPGRGRQGQQ
jgi:hypothetical protein